MTVAVRFAARTDVGLVRSRNEDSGYAGPHLLAVADGMGGHAGGNVASSLVIARLAPLDGDSHGSDDALEILAGSIADANRSLMRAMKDNSELQGMGTTLTALMRCGSTGLALVHIGDSRAYLLRDGVFTQITKDHSFVQSLVDSGRITEDEAEHHPQRSLVTRVLTGAAEDEPDLSMRQARLGDRYLICSDGLSDYVARDTITDVVSAGADPDETARRLVDLALKAGAPDNVTCVIGDIVDASSGGTQPVVVGAAAQRRGRATEPIALNPAQKAAALRREATGASDAPDDNDDDNESSRGRHVRAALVSVILLLVLGGSLFAAWSWSQSQLYVGEASGRVAIYRGLPQTLGPITLNSVEQTSDVDVNDLPEYFRQQVERTVQVTTIAEANQRVDLLRAQAQLCTTRRTQGIACGSGSP